MPRLYSRAKHMNLSETEGLLPYRIAASESPAMIGDALGGRSCCEATILVDEGLHLTDCGRGRMNLIA